MKPLAALTDRCCRWPVGPAPEIGQTQNQLWCAAPRAPGDWFCPEHMRKAFPRAAPKPAQAKARNLVTIKLALMRRRPAMSSDLPFDDDRLAADAQEEIEVREIEDALAAPESEEVAELRTRLTEGDEVAAPNLAEIEGPAPQEPTSTGFESGAQVLVGTLSTNVDCIHDKGITTADTLRPVKAIALTQIASPIPTQPPMVEWMAPDDLLIEAAYQRDLSPKSMDLIKRIAEHWDWRRFKPPIVAWTERGFEIIDGQHTAIGAATRGIDRIPVLVVEATDLTDRASAFVGHNQDRLTITPVQMHQAKIAAGDEDALTAQQVIDKAGAKLVVGAYGARAWKPGETVAITTIDALAKKRGAMRARQVIEVLVKAYVAPVSAAGIKAVDMLMFRPEFSEIDLEHLPAAIISAGDVEKQAKLDAKTHGITAWEAMGRIWFRKCRKIRKAA